MKPPLRLGLAGISALYWPMALADGIRARRDAILVSFATLGVPAPEIRHHIGMQPAAYARRYGMRQYVDLDEMIRVEELDAVAVCTRHTEHARWVERVAEHGIDAFVAKTFATDMNDANRICASEKRHGIHVAVGPSARFLPWCAAVRRVLDAGRIGTPFSLHISHHHGTIDVFGRRDFYRESAEGGPELSLAWYLVDLVLHLLSGPVSQVSAFYGNFTSPDSPFMDCGKLTLRLAGGAMASCDMYFCNRFEFPRWEMEIVGDRGAILVRQSAADPSSTSITLLSAGGRRAVTIPRPTRSWELFWIDDFRSGRASPLSAGYARLVTRICLAARESARKGKTVDLRETKNEH